MSSQPGVRKTIPVAKPFLGLEEERAVAEVLRSGWVSQGPVVAEFEKRFAAYVGAENAIAVSSCTTALHLALVAAGVRPGDEVLCPSLSFIATANAIVHAGAVPVFVDIDRDTYNMSPDRAEEAVTPRTRAILLVHQIGLPAAIDEIAAIAGRRGVMLVEDAACAIGSEYAGQRIGRPHSVAACFSFHPRKILTTGEGGMITTADGALAERIRRLRQHAMSVSDLKRHSSGQVVFEHYDEVGWNYRMTDIQAAVGLAQLARMDGFLSRRRYLANRYSQALGAVPWLKVPEAPTGHRHNFQSYMVRLLPSAPVTRDEVMARLLECGISTRRGIMAIHHEQPYSDPKWDALLPETNAAAATTIVLPLFAEMTDEDQDYIIERICNIAAH